MVAWAHLPSQPDDARQGDLSMEKVTTELFIGVESRPANSGTTYVILNPGSAVISGIGRNFGFEGIRQFQEVHSISGASDKIF